MSSGIHVCVTALSVTVYYIFEGSKYSESVKMFPKRYGTRCAEPVPSRDRRKLWMGHLEAWTGLGRRLEQDTKQLGRGLEGSLD